MTNILTICMLVVSILCFLAILLAPFIYELIEENKLDECWRMAHKEDYPRKYRRLFTKRNKEAEE